MKTFTFIFFLLTFSHLSFSQAKIHFKNTSVSYDDVKVGANGERVFSFKNIGNSPLIINKIESTSHHIQVISPSHSIAPGKSDEIKIIYDTRITGPIRRTLSVFSNAENLPVAALKIKGEIVEIKQIGR